MPANDYYDSTGAPSTSSTISSSTLRAEFDAIETGFTAVQAALALKASLTSPTLVTPNLGTPSAGVLTNTTGLPLTTGVTGTLPVANGGTGVTTSTGSGNTVLSTSPTLVTPILGTPTSGVATNLTGLPLTTGVTGTLPVANGGTGVTTSTGSGANVLATSPTLVTPILGTPTSGVATNLTGTAAGLTAGNVTTNANLTGHVTSVGNAAVLGSFTLSQLNTAISDADVATGGGTATGTNTGDQTNITGNAATVTTNANLTGDITSVGNATTLTRGGTITKTADFTVATTENWLANNKSGSTCTVTLPAASAFNGREIMITNYQAQLVVSATSNVVDIFNAGPTTAILPATAGKWVTLVSNGTNWKIMQSN